MGRPKRYKYNYPSVTEIVDILDKPGLRYWYGKHGTSACEQKKRDSQKIGHGVHKGIELFLKGKPFSEASADLDNRQTSMLSHLTNFVTSKKFRPLLMEEPMYSHNYKIAGTPDAIGTFNGGKSLICVDWKTDSVPRDKKEDRERCFKYKLQHAGYSLLYFEKFDVWVNKGMTVRISKDVEFSTHSFPALKEYRRLFLNLREIFKYVRGK